MARFEYTDDGGREAVLCVSAFGGILSTAFLAMFFLFWYGSIFRGAYSDPAGFFPAVVARLRANLGLWVFVLSPLFVLVPAILRLKSTVTGRRIRFDRAARTIFDREEKIAAFSDLSAVEVRPAASANGRMTNRLALVLKDGSFKTLVEDLDVDGLSAIAAQIAALAGVPFNAPAA